jgi:phospholipase/carboxylesterase
MARHESTRAEEQAVGLSFLYRTGAGHTAPLVVLIHGRAGDRSVMWMFERSVPEDCHVISFQAFLPDPLGGWSWWDMTTPGSKKEAIGNAASRLIKALEAFIEMHGLVPSRVVGMGFSQGSMLLSEVALRDFFQFDGIAILAGFVLVPTEPRALRKQPLVFVAHGARDERVPVAQAREGVAELEKRGIKVQYVEEDVGHKIGIEGTRALRGWLLRALGR